jgi:hypothetical protein
METVAWTPEFGRRKEPVSLYELGRAPVGSPTRIAPAARLKSTVLTIAAENVRRPVST